MTVCPDLDAAQHRVDALKESGIRPGIRLRPDGTCTLTYDPEDRSGQ